MVVLEHGRRDEPGATEACCRRQRPRAGGKRDPSWRGSPCAVSLRAIAVVESGEKSERQCIRRIASRGSPSTVGESTAAPAPGRGAHADDRVGVRAGVGLHGCSVERHHQLRALRDRVVQRHLERGLVGGSARERRAVGPAKSASPSATAMNAQLTTVRDGARASASTPRRSESERLRVSRSPARIAGPSSRARTTATTKHTSAGRIKQQDGVSVRHRSRVERPAAEGDGDRHRRPTAATSTSWIRRRSESSSRVSVVAPRATRHARDAAEERGDRPGGEQRVTEDRPTGWPAPAAIRATTRAPRPPRGSHRAASSRRPRRRA